MKSETQSTTRSGDAARAEAQPRVASKLTYASPRLTNFGRVADITRGGVVSPNSDSGQNGMSPFGP